ncbi:MAG TPA: class I SAM-dependent methyltransferase [Solirubrobacteraceae bacterium]|jgi:SAM-dependent methyltransferase
MSVTADRERWEATQRGLWGQRPEDWAELAEPQNVLLFTDALDEAGVGRATAVLDVGCGSGLALSLADERGARTSGIDISPSLLDVARRHVPGADLREGGLDVLPFDDESFDAVLAINALQFAADPGGALCEIRRVLRPGGRLAIGGFAAPETCESTALHLAMESLVAPDRHQDHAPYALAAPGALERALTDARLTVTLDREQPGDWRYADLDHALRGLLSSAGGARAIGLAGEDRVREVLTEALAPFRTPDGAYVMHNRFRLTVAERPA